MRSFEYKVLVATISEFIRHRSLFCIAWIRIRHVKEE